MTSRPIPPAQWTASTGGSFSVGSGVLSISTSNTYVYLKQAQGTPGILSTDITFPGGATSGQISLIYGSTKLTADIGAQTVAFIDSGYTHGTHSATITAGVPFTLSMKLLPQYVAPIGVGLPDYAIAPTSASPKIGFYTSVAGASFGPLTGFNPAARANLWGRWTAGTTPACADVGCLWPAPGGTVYGAAGLSPVLLKNLSLSKFQADFEGMGTQFIFDAKDDYNWKSISIDSSGVFGSQMEDGNRPDVVSGTTDTNQIPSDSGPDWVRVTCDGSTVTVRAAATQSGLDSASPCFTSSGFNITGGQFGFADYDGGEPTNVTIKSYNTSASSFNVTEAVENFAVTSDYMGLSTLSYDANGNLTYDGLQSYTYDAWNRLKKVAHAYRIAVGDGGDGNVHSGQTSGTYSYDAAGRRIVKAVSGTGSMDCTYHDYYAGQSNIEERNGSNQSIKDRVWGLEYIDEAVQTRVNTNPTGTASWTSYWLCQDANYNVLGVVNTSGTLAERYEYSAYGQRQVFTSSGSNDPGCYTPTNMSSPVIATGSVVEPYSINEVGHQGLVHDEESELIYNRNNYVDGTLGRFLSTNGLWPIDGLSFYQYQWSNPINGEDPFGLADNTGPVGTGWQWLTGTSPVGGHNFGNGDPFTEQLRQHQHIKDVIALVTKQLQENCKICGTSQIIGIWNYDLSGFKGVPSYLKDYSTLATFGMTGNLAVTYLGSYTLEYATNSINCQSGKAALRIHVHNSSTIQSATHPPVIGYTHWWSQHIGSPLDNYFSSGPMSRTDQDFVWDELIQFAPNNKCCKK